MVSLDKGCQIWMPVMSRVIVYFHFLVKMFWQPNGKRRLLAQPGLIKKLNVFLFTVVQTRRFTLAICIPNGKKFRYQTVSITLTLKTHKIITKHLLNISCYYFYYHRTINLNRPFSVQNRLQNKSLDTLDVPIGGDCFRLTRNTHWVLCVGWKQKTCSEQLTECRSFI